jgi:2-polyprenyl-6-methoxyphenol hydroxylase-like FAD-dependent oxidoreductase
VRYEVIVIGAGGGGAILGIALASRGVRVCVIEREQTLPPLQRAETIQPNGQQILDRLGVLGALGEDAVQAVQRFHFIQIGGQRLCTVDYGMLPPPWNRALVTQSSRVHGLILSRLRAEPTADLQMGVEFQSVIQNNGVVRGIIARPIDQKHPIEIEASLVVGADGAGSRVRQALGVKATVHRYPHGYLLALVPRPATMHGEARYYIGRGELLGLFPAPENRLIALYMVKGSDMNAIKAQGLEAFKERIITIDSEMRESFQALRSWDQVGYLPCFRVRADRWVTNGAALIGDAAHAMNPHASQGRMQAMTDAMVLSDVIVKCRTRNDWSAEALLEYETARRPQVTMLQRLADERTTFWNASDPLRCRLRDRVFRGIDKNARLRYQVLTATAGLRTTPPLTWMDKLIAVGHWPDPHANELPPP